MPYPFHTGLTFGIPLSGKPIHPQMMFAYSQLHPPMCFNMTTASTWMQEIGVARNWFAEKAIEQKSKYLFFLDEDVVAPGHTLRQLIYQMEHHPEMMVVGGIYCHKSPPAMPMIFRGLGKGPYWDWHLGELFEVDGISMGCTLIRTEVFQKLDKPWFKTVDNFKAYWDGVPKGEVWTEDLYFCHQVKEVYGEGSIWADASVICEHMSCETMTGTTLPPDCLPMKRAAIPKGKKKIVDLGCGENKLQTSEGEVWGVDIRELSGVDYRSDLGCLPFATGEMDVVYSSHVLEHFPRKRVPEVLDEWIRILKPDGELRLILPNAQWAAERIMNDQIDNDVQNVILGAQSFGGKGDEFNFHKFFFTPKLLEEMLTSRGFKRIDFTLDGYNICVRAWKKPPAGLAKLNGHKNGRKKLKSKR